MFIVLVSSFEASVTRVTEMTELRLSLLLLLTHTHTHETSLHITLDRRSTLTGERCVELPFYPSDAALSPASPEEEAEDSDDEEHLTENT